MTAETRSPIAGFIWGICNLLRGPYKRNEYRKVILPLTVLRCFDSTLAPTKAAVLKEHAAIKAKGENINDQIATRYMGDKEVGRAVFVVLSKAIYDSIPPDEAPGDS